ncbi:acetyl/propionyl/methylcrotonyl-CoA carboxylase subunit alpha [Bermanella marisrubri]|uniref:Biotin carboxylase n=1 Tax=Bermanella marisrubri TaxID=207949 RepID=Q1N580_9GAMM|nr:acetyl/propionyl/methylcrotonyl-CoA carboxylase subunit alpha [Bermanella marisrubri]EAT13198.1 Acetyl/propionyl-CoA carboxylase, alpha subunit [Oceanobacter sp. RED65] [Bermanella marisrubri]QIZ83968.1 acetyl/propionyl/methylcrotonyl-CoA carboxylase subunit alpha [Bermanella marisrubri]
MKDFTKILVANRGEIALRVMKTAKALGYETVAVYSEADADAPHVSFADEAVCIGPAQVNQSYLNISRIVEACKQTGANAVHPGYGFLSENTDFCQACQDNNITFIGPDPKAINLMGSKRLSKIEMLKAKVPCIPGYEGSDQSDETLFKEAKAIGFPVMIKASAGGGGRGMRIVKNEAEFAAQLKTAKSEALNAFGSDEMILEKAIMEPRHIEIQIFADRHGNCIYLGERDCSVQRRHQKVVEEAPSPFVSEAMRQSMGEAAVNAAKACDYVGAGTVEFLADKNGDFYFLEMNTRLQVEHPVTELVTGTDLVAWQIQVAAGQTLPMTQEQVQIKGHAVEVRLYAEDPSNAFMPQTGKILQWQYKDLDGLRMDAGIQQGQMVTPFYDPMLAKVIAYGENRDIARRKLMKALKSMTLLGVKSNRGFLYNILAHQSFANGDATTAFIEEDFADDMSMEIAGLTKFEQALAAWIQYLHYAQAQDAERRFWRNSNPAPTWLSFESPVASEKQNFDVAIHIEDSRKQAFVLQVEDERFPVSLLEMADNEVMYEYQGIKRSLAYAIEDQRLFMATHGGCCEVLDITHAPRNAAGSAGDGKIKASMDGAIVDVQIEVGQKVTVGDTLVVLEAMKMEHSMKADCEGEVTAVNVSIGDQVKGQQLLVEIALASEEAETA